jgi:hypothetical protein
MTLPKAYKRKQPNYNLRSMSNKMNKPIAEIYKMWTMHQRLGLLKMAQELYAQMKIEDPGWLPAGQSKFKIQKQMGAKWRDIIKRAN